MSAPPRRRSGPGALASFQAIATTYQGIRFRSRLEAKWAAWFDAVSWPWVYEPVDLQGYIPDFVLMFPAGSIAVEVKPAFAWADVAASAAPKIEASGWTEDALIVGASLFDPSDEWERCAHRWDPGGWDAPAIACGWLGEYVATADDARGFAFAWADALVVWCDECRSVSLRSADHDYRCRRYGCNDTDGDLDKGRARARAAWAVATNRVQWAK